MGISTPKHQIHKCPTNSSYHATNPVITPEPSTYTTSHHRFYPHHHTAALSTGIVPIPPPRQHRHPIPHKPVLVKVEERELVPRHDVRLRRSLHLGPKMRQRRLEDVADGGVRRAVGALARNLERLAHDGVDARLGEGGRGRRRGDGRGRRDRGVWRRGGGGGGALPAGRGVRGPAHAVDEGEREVLVAAWLRGEVVRLQGHGAVRGRLLGVARDGEHIGGREGGGLVVGRDGDGISR